MSDYLHQLYPYPTKLFIPLLSQNSNIQNFHPVVLIYVKILLRWYDKPFSATALSPSQECFSFVICIHHSDMRHMSPRPPATPIRTSPFGPTLRWLSDTSETSLASLRMISWSVVADPSWYTWCMIIRRWFLSRDDWRDLFNIKAVSFPNRFRFAMRIFESWATQALVDRFST